MITYSNLQFSYKVINQSFEFSSSFKVISKVKDGNER